MARPLILLIAYHFPPDDAIGGARPYRFYKYLKRLGYECHVLTAAAQSANALPDVEHVPDPLRVKPRTGLAWQAERIGWKFLLRAELTLGWSAAVFRAGRSFLSGRKNENITILSSAPPVGTHLAAMRLAAYSGHRWIADFRDPINSIAGDRALLEDIVAPAVERWILQRADLILANTDAMRRLWLARYSGVDGKIHALWNGFDPEDAIDSYDLPVRNCRILSHVGELYGGRDIRPILNAAARLIERGRVTRGSLTIRQIGNVDPDELPDPEFVRSARAEGWLEFREAVPAKEARGLALDSDGLLLIQPHTAIQVPGKLFDYLRMGRPVLAYIVRDSPVEHILRQAGVPFEAIYPEHSAEEIDRRLLSFIAKLDGRPVRFSQWFEDTFEASRQITALDALIQSLRT